MRHQQINHRNDERFHVTELYRARSGRASKIAAVGLMLVVVTITGCDWFNDGRVPSLKPRPGTHTSKIWVGIDDRNDYDYFYSLNPYDSIHAFKPWWGDFRIFVDREMTIRVFSVSDTGARSKIYEFDYRIGTNDGVAPTVRNSLLFQSPPGYLGYAIAWQGAEDNATSWDGIEYAIYSSDSLSDVSTYDAAISNGDPVATWGIPEIWDHEKRIFGYSYNGTTPGERRWVNVFARDGAGNVSAYSPREMETAPIMSLYVGMTAGGDEFRVQNGDGFINVGPTPGPTPGIVLAADFGDFDGDGFGELVVSHGGPTGVSVYQNMKDGTVNPVPIDLDAFLPNGDPVIATTLETADMNRDGVVDLVITDERENPNEIYVVEFDGLTPDDWTSVSGPNESALAMAVGDVTGDGLLDIAIAYANEEVHIFEQDTTGEYSPLYNFGLAGVTDVIIRDINDDKIGDLLVTSADMLVANRLILSQGGGTFVPIPVSGWVPGQITLTAEIADFNNDELNDIILYDGLSYQVWRNRGDLSFVLNGDVPSGSEPFKIQAVDMDGDSYRDLMILNDFGNRVQVYLNNPASPGFFFLHDELAAGPYTTFAAGRLR